MRIGNVQVGGGVAVVAIALLATASLAVPRAAASDFAIPARLKTQVDFWIRVFTAYGKRQVVIHDTERLDRIYSVLDFSDLDSAGLSETQIQLAMKDEEDAEKARVRALLYRLDQVDPRSDYLTQEEERIVALFADDPSPDRFRAAADRLRGQRGLRERFARGIQVGHAYFPAMEQIFRDEGVPVEITRLPLVESCFNIGAYSKSGAAGIWQFMPGTGRRFLRIDGSVDERLDPIVATRAAAQFMRANYIELGTWPLAIKAYNHGPAGIARAVRDTGTTDAATIIESYRGPSYKFASRNFYPEFLAALHVERNYRKYFGDLPLDPPPAADTIYVTGYTPINAAARCAGTDPWEIATLNPSLLPPVRDGRLPIPSGFALRLPNGSGRHAAPCVANLPAPAPHVARRAAERTTGARARKTRSDAVVHRVKRGQTLSQIANLYGCSVERIRRGNKLESNKLHAGQLLRIPTS
jgi:membrane-bound lytic murein transglycosylase D